MRKLFVLIAAVAFLVAFTAPAFAAEWSFYGSSRLTTFWYNQSGAYSDTNNSDLDLTWDMQGNSRIGANVKAGDIAGTFELGMPNDKASVRLIWGEYDFGGWKLGIGQHYSPMNFFISNQVFDSDTDMLPFGGVYSGRNPMLRFRMGNLDIALVEPDTDAYNDTEGCIIDTDVILPRLEARYGLNMGAFYLEFGGGAQTYDVVGTKPNGNEGDDEDIMSYLGYVGAKWNAGAFYFAANAYMGQNIGDMTLNFGDQPADEAVIKCDKDGERPNVKDTDTYGLLGVVAFTLNDMLRLEGGIGYVNSDNNEYDDDDETMAYYVQATINIAKGIFLVPEVGYIDLDNNSEGDSQGSISYYGAKWQINF
jgi:hypothetical protein